MTDKPNEALRYISIGEVDSGPKIPYDSPDKNFKILRATGTEVCSVLTLSPNSGTTDLMDFLEKEFWRKVTTRNWNTIAKVFETNKS